MSAHCHHPKFDSIDEKLAFQLMKCSHLMARRKGGRGPQGGPRPGEMGPGPMPFGPGPMPGPRGQRPEGPGPRPEGPGPRPEGPGPQEGRLHPGQLHVLEALEEKDGITQSELRQKLDIRAASLSELLVKLENKGLVYRERSEADKRSVNVYLTDLGSDCLTEAKEFKKKRAQELLKGLDNTEKEQLSELLSKLMRSWRKDSEDEGPRD